MIEKLLALDAIRLNFSDEGIVLMNIILAFIMFGVALEIKPENFKRLVTAPRSVIVGIVSQVILLPAITFVAVMILPLTPTVSLGMILVAACPGGNISNFISATAKANVELSVSLTAFTTLASPITTPLNFMFWGSLYISNSPLIRPIEIPFLQVFQTVIILLGLPLVVGIWFSKKFPTITAKILKPVKIASIFAFIGFVIGALSANFDNFLKFIHIVLPIVILHNGLALFTGYFSGTAIKIPRVDRRTITIETGIQNSGLALALIFNPKIFPVELELGGMAFIAAVWGIWHMFSGIGFALLWSKIPSNESDFTYFFGRWRKPHTIEDFPKLKARTEKRKNSGKTTE